MTNLVWVIVAALGAVAMWLWRQRPTRAVEAVILTVPKDALYQRAVTLTAEAEARHSPAHGEVKRHQVFAQLEKEFPAALGRAIARAIEAAL